MDKFTQQYLETALWSSIISHPGSERNGDPFDSHFNINDFSQDTIQKATKDCNDFQEKNWNNLIDEDDDDDDDAHAGHNFWLTRNGHGAGFWDGNYGEEKGERLTLSAEKYTELNITIGDNNTLYFI